MPFTVQNVIDEARDRNRAFTELHTPDRSLLRFLNNLQRRLTFLIHKRNPDQLIEVHNITFPLTVFADGEDISGLTPPLAIPVGGTIHLSDPVRDHPLTIVPWRNRFSPGQGPAAYIEDETLFFVGRETDWTQVSSVDFYYVGEPTALAAEGDTVVLPDAARPTCVEHLAAFMAMRGPQDKTLPVPDFRAAALASEEDFLDEIGRKRRAKTFVVREVW